MNKNSGTPFWGIFGVFGGSRSPTPAALLTGALLLGTVTGCQKAQKTPEGYQGIVEFDERVLAFEFGGRLTSVDVERGDLVTKGKPIASIDDTLQKSVEQAREREVEAARSQVDLLKAGSRREDILAIDARIRAAQAVEARISSNLERERELAKRGVTPLSVVADLEQDLARAKAERQALEQNRAALQKGARKEEVAVASSQADALGVSLTLENQRLDKHRLTSPVDGEVLEVHAEIGETVAPGSPVVTLGETDHPYADVFVPEGALAGIHLGGKATLRVDATAHPFSGKIEHIGRRTEFTPRFLFSDQERPNLVVRVRVRIDDPKRELHAGVPAFAKLEH